MCAEVLKMRDIICMVIFTVLLAIAIIGVAANSGED